MLVFDGKQPGEEGYNPGKHAGEHGKAKDGAGKNICGDGAAGGDIAIEGVGEGGAEEKEQKHGDNEGDRPLAEFGSGNKSPESILHIDSFLRKKSSFRLFCPRSNCVLPLYNEI